MKRFDYRAKERDTGKNVRGSIQADSEQAAGKLLVEQGYIPEKLVEKGGDGLLARLTNKVRAKDRIVFTRQFAILIGAGLPLASSLRTVAEQTQSKAMKGIIEELLANVEAGKSLYEAFAKHPDVFSGVYLALIHAGEMSGTLDESLRRLADQEEKDAALAAKIRQAMVYPAIILVVIIAVLAFMMIEVVPQVADLYDSMDKELPALTKFLVNLTNFFAQWWWVVIIVVAVVVWGLTYLVKNTETGRKRMDQLKLHMPLFGKLYIKLYVSRFARTVEMMLATGVQMLDAVKISAESTSNKIVEEEYSKALEVLKGGGTLSQGLKDLKYMLPLVPQMASIGEESGKIDEMLGRAAAVYEAELDEEVNNISTLIEPILMVLMAGLIGVVIGGTLLPIYSLVSQIA